MTDSDLTSRSAAVLAGGATHVARSYAPAVHVVEARGSRKWLADGRELVDYTMGHGALLLGHAHPAVVAAVAAQVARGTHFGAGSALEVEWAERICRLVPSVQRVRFTSSGTEATMLALRLARAATGRDPVVKLDDHFHGWHDAVSVNLDENGTPRTDVGVPATTLTTTRVVRAGDTAALATALDGAAALILEASGAHYGRTPIDPGFVAAARELCDASGAVLILDEVVTGFRVHPGGMQHLLGVRPDLTAFGKVMAGGLPGGAVGGRSELMDLLAVREGRFVAHPGTFNANPLTASAGIATLDLVATGAPGRRAEDVAIALEEGVRERCRCRVWRLSSIVHLSLDDDRANAALSLALRDEGVDLLRTSAFCSAVHSDDDIAFTLGAMERSLRRVLAR